MTLDFRTAGAPIDLDRARCDHVQTLTSFGEHSGFRCAISHSIVVRVATRRHIIFSDYAHRACNRSKKVRRIRVLSPVAAAAAEPSHLLCRRSTPLALAARLAKNMPTGWCGLPREGGCCPVKIWS